MERAAETFQDRLVPELHLTGAVTIDQASQVLEQFPPRFDAQFGVPAEQPEAAYPPVDPGMNLAEILCFKNSCRVALANTVKYQFRILQLPFGKDRPTYADAQVEVLDQVDGSLQVRHGGQTVSVREDPLRPVAMRAAHGALASMLELGHVVNRLTNHHLAQPQLRKLASLGDEVAFGRIPPGETVRCMTSEASKKQPSLPN